MPEHFSEAVDAACDRIEAVLGGAAGVAAFERMRLAFVGLDIDHDEYREVSDRVSLRYGEPVIQALGEALAADSDHFAVGYHVGRRLSQALAGAFAMGVLAGELHRERTIRDERKAASDD